MRDQGKGVASRPKEGDGRLVQHGASPHHYVTTVNIGKPPGRGAAEPESGLALSQAPDLRQSDEFMVGREEGAGAAASRKRLLNKFEIKPSKQSSVEQSPSVHGSASPHQKFFNSTLHKSQVSTMGRNLQELGPGASQSPKHLYADREVRSGEGKQTVLGNIEGAGEGKPVARYNAAGSPGELSPVPPILDYQQNAAASKGQPADGLMKQQTLQLGSSNPPQRGVEMIKSGASQSATPNLPGKLEIKVQQKGALDNEESSPYARSPTDQPSPDRPTMYQSSLKRGNDASALSQADPAKLDSTLKKGLREGERDTESKYATPLSDKQATGQAADKQGSNNRYYVIQKHKRPNEGEAGIEPAEAEQADNRKRPSLNQIPDSGAAHIPEMPEISDLATPSPQSHLHHLRNLDPSRSKVVSGQLPQGKPGDIL